MADNESASDQGLSIRHLKPFKDLSPWLVTLIDRIFFTFLVLVVIIVFWTMIRLLITFLDFESVDARITPDTFNKIWG